MQRFLPTLMFLVCGIAGVAAKEPDREFLVGYLKGDYVVDTTGKPDQIPVLRMRFTLDGKSYEATYLWTGDLDNYGRITGYVFLPTRGATKSPGLEALFPLEPLSPPNP